MSIKIIKNRNNILSHCNYNSVLLAKALAVELFGQFGEQVDDDGEVAFIIRKNYEGMREDEFEVTLDQETVEPKRMTLKLIDLLLFNLEEDELYDSEEYDLEITILTNTKRVTEMGLFETEPSEIEDEEDPLDSDGDHQPAYVDYND